MEKRIGSIIILVREKEHIHQLNDILTYHASIIIGRQGIPLKERSISIISLIIEGTVNEINALTGQLGKLGGITARATLVKE